MQACASTSTRMQTRAIAASNSHNHAYKRLSQVHGLAYMHERASAHTCNGTMRACNKQGVPVTYCERPSTCAWHCLPVLMHVRVRTYKSMQSLRSLPDLILYTRICLWIAVCMRTSLGPHRLTKHRCASVASALWICLSCTMPSDGPVNASAVSRGGR